MNLVGLKAHFYSTASEKNSVGEKLPALWVQFMERIGEIDNTVPGICYAVVRHIKEDSGFLEYYSAIEVSSIVGIPGGMDSIEIPPTQYAKFTHKGEAQQVDNTVNYIYSRWLLASEKRHTAGPDLEVYGDEYDPVSVNPVMHCAIPVE